MSTDESLPSHVNHSILAFLLVMCGVNPMEENGSDILNISVGCFGQMNREKIDIPA